MDLYSLTLSNPSSITSLTTGNFITKNSQELIIIRGSQILQIFSQNKKNLLSKKIEISTFAQIRKISKFRPLGNKTDFLILTSDSGKLTILSFYIKNEKIEYKILISQIITKTGCRRISQGYYLASDPKGRALLLASTEKNKIAFLTKRENLDDFAISSPIEANLENLICFDIVGIDIGYENPFFVSLEVNYGDQYDKHSILNTGVIKKKMVFYEIDLGLNSILKKKEIFVNNNSLKILNLNKEKNRDACFFLVCKNEIFLYDTKGTVLDQIFILRRIDRVLKKKNDLEFINYCFFKHKKYIFYLLQNNLGDIFKLNLNLDNKIEFNYLCTSKIATKMCLLKTGYLFIAIENDNHEFYAVKNLESVQETQFKPSHSENSQKQILKTPKIYIPLKINNFPGLEKVQEMENLSGLVNIKYLDLQQDTIGKYYSIQSGINGSYIKILKQGIKFDNMACSKLPIIASKIWCLTKIGKNKKDLTDIIILGNNEKSFVLKAGEKIEEFKEDLGFLLDRESLIIFENFKESKKFVNDDNTDFVIEKKIIGYTQVTKERIRFINEEGKIKDWMVESNQTIQKCCLKKDKLIIVLSSKELIYFEQNYDIYKEIARKNFESQILCLKINKKKKNRTNTNFLAIGFSDNSLRIFSLEKENCLMRLSLQMLNAPSENILFLDNILLVGLSSGYLSKNNIDLTTGALEENRLMKICENFPLNIFEINNFNKIKGCIISGGDKNFLYYKNKGQFCYKHLILDKNEKIKSLTILKSKFGENCIIYITENQELKICKFKDLDKNFNVKSKKLEFSARNILIHPESLSLIILQSQNRTLNSIEKEKRYEILKQNILKMEKGDKKLNLIDKKLLNYSPLTTDWCSKISLINPMTLKTISEISLTQKNCHIIKISLFNIKEIENESFLLVSICEEHNIIKNTYKNTYINFYGIQKETNQFNFIHKTNLKELATSFFPYKNKLLIAVGGFLRLYQMGKKQLLKKCEFKKKFRIITNIKVVNDRIFITDASDSVHMVIYNEKENQFYEIADDILPRYCTSFEIIDFHTVAISDKFGNFVVLRLPQSAEEEFNEDFGNYKMTWEMGYLNGAPVKFTEIVSYYFVNVITSIQCASIGFKNKDQILIGDVEGRIGVLIPFDYKNQLDFFRHLEMFLKNPEFGKKNVVGRNHVIFRSYYGSAKGIIDGDFCEEFFGLERKLKEEVLEGLEIREGQVLDMFEEIKFKIL